MTIDWGCEDRPQGGFRFTPVSRYTATIYYGPPLDCSKSSDATIHVGDVLRFRHGRLYCFRNRGFAYVELRSCGKAQGRLLRAQINSAVRAPDGGIYEWAFDLEDVYDICTPWSDNDPPMTISWSMQHYREHGAQAAHGRPCSYPAREAIRRAYRARGMTYTP